MEISTRKPTVLAVDDKENNLVALQAVLAKDYNLVFAYSGSEAISILRTNQNIDVILMDVQMPEMDGFETAAEIKRLEGAKEIPIIFITAIYKEEPFIKRGYAAGGVDYFSKPFDPEILKLKLSIYASFRQRAEILRRREMQVKDTEELLRVGRKFSAVLESLPVGVLISDVHGRICQINEQVSRICNHGRPTDSDSYGKMLGWWDSEGKMLTASGPLYRALNDGNPFHSETIQIDCKNGDKKTIVCSASPLLGLDGHVVGAVIVLQDFTESKKIEADLKDRITRVVSVGVELEETLPQA